MKLIIKNKFFSLGQGSSVKDEQGNDAFIIKGKVFSITKKKKIYDTNKNLLYVVRNKFWTWLSRAALIYNADGEKIAKVTQKTYEFKKRYYIEEYQDDLLIKGKTFSLGYQVMKGEEELAKITRKITLVNDTFELETQQEDISFYVALVIAMDNITDARRKEND